MKNEKCIICAKTLIFKRNSNFTKKYCDFDCAYVASKKRQNKKRLEKLLQKRGIKN